MFTFDPGSTPDTVGVMLPLVPVMVVIVMQGAEHLAHADSHAGKSYVM